MAELLHKTVRAKLTLGHRIQSLLIELEVRGVLELGASNEERNVAVLKWIGDKVCSGLDQAQENYGANIAVLHSRQRIAELKDRLMKAEGDRKELEDLEAMGDDIYLAAATQAVAPDPKPEDESLSTD